ncbi:MAG: glycosyltransferase family 2 protein [Sphingobacteriales bacterium]|nr:MAG: glycosyltransferase family 2 protein [Sphingobacteriales bacterium]TAF78390.1 MAG: glycosyltransferase family 2 protein [Sphingobacteriales bacterium]
MNFPKVAIVILNWNGKTHLQQFLPSVINSSYLNIEIIVGDNDSTDGSVEFITANYPQVTIIKNEKNFGFAQGYNKVLSQVNSDYFVLLNSDVEVTPHWIEPIISLMESDANIAIAQPKIKAYYRKTHFEYAGAAGCFMDSFAYPFCRGRVFDTVEEDKGQYDNDIEIFWATGCALFIKAPVWKSLHGLDEAFFAHMEEIDLCWRAKNLGYRVMYCGQATVYHIGGGTLSVESPFKTYLNFRNNLFLIKKNMPPMQANCLIFIRFILDFLALIKFVCEGKIKNALAISKAHRHGIKAFLKKEIKYNNHVVKQPNTVGRYTGSIVWDYFVLGKKRFGGIGNIKVNCF